METEQGEAGRPVVSFSRTHQLAAGTGIGLTFFRIFQAHPLSTRIELGDGAVKLVKSRRGPLSAPHLVVLASKALLKGYKASKRLELIKGRPGSSSFDVRRLKGFVGALNLARYALVPPVGGVLWLNLAKVGYKESKNFVKVLEGFWGEGELDSILRRGVEALGLFVKTMDLSREFARIAELGIAQKFQREGGIQPGASTCGFVSKHALYCNPDIIIRRVHGGGRLSLVHLPLCRDKKGLGMEKDLKFGLSELFSLSIPLRLLVSISCKNFKIEPVKLSKPNLCATFSLFEPFDNPK